MSHRNLGSFGGPVIFLLSITCSVSRITPKHYTSKIHRFPLARPAWAWYTVSRIKH